MSLLVEFGESALSQYKKVSENKKIGSMLTVWGHFMNFSAAFWSQTGLSDTNSTPTQHISLRTHTNMERVRANRFLFKVKKYIRMDEDRANEDRENEGDGGRQKERERERERERALNQI